MKEKKLLTSLLVGATMFAMTIPVFAQQENATSSNQTIDTQYSTVEHEVQVPVETYDVSITWNNLHWIFVYEGSPSNPTRYQWITENNYAELATEYNTQDSKAEAVLEGNYTTDYSWKNAPEYAWLMVMNNDSGAINASASVGQKANQTDYTSPANLQVAYNDGVGINYSAVPSLNYSTTSTKSNLGYHGMVYFWVKPTVDRYVNNTGNIASVAGEIEFTFSKYTSN